MTARDYADMRRAVNNARRRVAADPTVTDPHVGVRASQLAALLADLDLARADAAARGRAGQRTPWFVSPDPAEEYVIYAGGNARRRVAADRTVTDPDVPRQRFHYGIPLTPGRPAETPRATFERLVDRLYDAYDRELLSGRYDGWADEAPGID